MSMPILPPYAAPFKPVPQVTPFTYRDGVTMLKKLDNMVKYINRTLVPFVNENYSEIANEFETQVNILIEQVNTALANQTAEVDDKIQELVDYVNQQVAIIIGDSVEVQDAVVAEIFNNASSLTRIVTDELYANKAETNIELDRLSTDIEAKADQTALDATNSNVTDLSAIVETKADQTSLDSTNTDVSNLTERVVDLEEEVETPTKDPTLEAIKVKRGGQYDIGMYTRLRDGILNPTLTTRVLVLGSSSANGGLPTYPDQGMFQRLAYRCGSSDYRRLEDVVAGPPSGMHWWSGSIGGSDTTNYYPATYPAKVAILNPNYVIHMIGSNDWARNIDIPTFKANLNNVCASIEAANSNAINVIVHQQQRRDTTPSSGLSWAAYGNAMREVSEMVPDKRTYLDADNMMSLLGLGSDNRAGFLSPDNVHLMNVGNKFMADIIGGEMGIPSESEYAPISDIRNFTFPPSASYNANTVISSIAIEAANYPRQVNLAGVAYVNSSHGNNEVVVTLKKVSDGSVLKGSERRTGTMEGNPLPIDGVFYIPPMVATILEVSLILVSGTLYVSGSETFTNATALILPA